MTEFKTQEAIEYIRGILKAFRYTVPAGFMDEVERVLNAWDEETPMPSEL